jgi:transposase-like protein
MISDFISSMHFPHLDNQNPKGMSYMGETIHVWLTAKRKTRLNVSFYKISFKKNQIPQVVMTPRLPSTLGCVPGAQIWQLSKQESDHREAK